MDVEESIVRTFIVPSRRSRWLASLRHPARRTGMLDRLNHCRDLDDRYARLLPSSANVVALLRSRGAPERCYVLSNYKEIDGRTMPLDEAVWAAETGGYGTIVCCVAGKLAYYYDECGERRMLLERPPHKQPF
jgi:hypothetical protein